MTFSFAPAVLPPGLFFHGQPCPQPMPAGPPVSFPKPKYTRYQDPRLQEAYARLVAATRELSVPIYGKVFSEDAADTTARQLVDAVRALPESSDLRNRVRCAIEPDVRGAARAAVGELLLGAFAFGLTGMVVWMLVRAR